MIYTLVLASSLLQQLCALYAGVGEHKSAEVFLRAQVRAMATELVPVAPGPPARLWALSGSSTRR